MNYGLAKNPHKINALNRGNSKAPINNLIRPQKFATGGSVRALEQIMPYSPEDSMGEVDKSWEMMGAQRDRVAARERTKETAEAAAREIQKKNKKHWFLKAFNTAITIMNPFAGAIISGLTTYQHSKRAHDESEKALAGYKGTFLEDYFEDIEKDMYENKGTAGVYDFFTNLALSKLSGQDLSKGWGTELAGDVVVEGAKDIAVEGAKDVATDTAKQSILEKGLDFGADIVGGGLAGVDPAMNTLVKLLAEIPAIKPLMAEGAGLNVATTFGMHELSQPGDPEVDLSAYDQLIKSGPSQVQLARQTQVS